MDEIHCNCCVARSIFTSMILGDLTQQQKKINSLGKSTVSIPRVRYTNVIVPASAAAVVLQSAVVVHDQCFLWWDAGKNLSVQTQHPLPPPLVLHHPPSAQTEYQSLGGPQGAQPKMQTMGHINTLLPFTSGDRNLLKG